MCEINEAFKQLNGFMCETNEPSKQNDIG